MSALHILPLGNGRNAVVICKMCKALTFAEGGQDDHRETLKREVQDFFLAHPFPELLHLTGKEFYVLWKTEE